MPNHNNDSYCLVCCDEQSKVVFSCNTFNCQFKLCADCVRFAFTAEDGSGTNTTTCPSCRQTCNAVKMVEAVVGSMAVKAVENEMRSKVEFDVSNRLEVRKNKSAKLAAISDRARIIFNEITEELLLKCPSCKTAFLDYNGCNALYCHCGCKFCAICLKDCGADAHPHVRAEHGNVFDTQQFHTETSKRKELVIQQRTTELLAESEELQLLVKNHLDKAGIMAQEIDERTAQMSIALFLRQAKESLMAAIQNDRLSLLSNPVARGQGMDIHSISPRHKIPENFRLKLKEKEDKLYEVLLTTTKDNIKWTPVPLDTKNKPDDKKRDLPDVLLNLVSTLKCAVIAVQGSACLYQTSFARKKNMDNDSKNYISIEMKAIDTSGNVKDNPAYLGGNISILGVLGNHRISLLSKHVNATNDESLVFEPLKHMIGASKPLPLMDKISFAVPDTIADLNDDQKRVAHPLHLKTAMEVAGPPGTGKTKTIIELTRSILDCTDYDIIVMSERNGAIDAIAEKFASTCMKHGGHNIQSISDIPLWLNVMTFGASSVGQFTKMFTLDEKLKHHPEIVEMTRKQSKYGESLDALSKHQRELLSKILEDFGNKYYDDTIMAVRAQAESILKNSFNDLTRPTDVISCVKRVTEQSQGLDWSTLEEADFEKLVDDFTSFMGLIFIKRSDKEKKVNHHRSWIQNKQGIMKKYLGLLNCFTKALKDALFDEEKADKLLQKWKDAQNELKILVEKLKVKLVHNARLKMCTIGSSHKLPRKGRDEVQGDDDNDVLYRLSNLSVAPNNLEMNETLVIFDEAGCIPAYELLGLSSLNCIVKSLIVVGDIHQLPPYDSGAGSSAGYGQKRHGKQFQKPVEKKVQSLLSVSTLTGGDAKIQLKVQYRVPLDIANLLNARIYKGQYNTCKNCKVPHQGFRFVDVPFKANRQRDYVNNNEVDIVIQLVQQLKENGEDSVMILTPYKNQQREIQFQFKRQGLDKLPYPVLTIDQCQGQEANVVILSMVRRPTRFLTKNRFNVALSRVRQTLYFLADRKLFREASRDSGWDCSLLAQDLLGMSVGNINRDIDYNDDSWDDDF